MEASLRLASTPRIAPRKKRATKRARLGPGVERLAYLFVFLLLTFILTTFKTPIPKTFVNVVRWVVLFGVVGYFLLARRYAVRGYPLSINLFLLVCLISSVRSDVWTVSIGKFIPMSLSLILMFYLLPAVFKSESYRHTFFLLSVLLTAMSAVSAVYGLAQGRLVLSSRYAGLFGGPNSEGAYLGFAIFSALWLYTEYPQFRYRQVLQLIIASNLLGLYATRSRSAFFGVLAGGMIWSATQLVRTQSRKRQRFITVVIFLAGVVFVTRGFFAQGWDLMIRKTSSGSDFLVSRLWIWEDSIEAFKKRPYFGFGYGVNEIAEDTMVLSATGTGTVRDGSGYFGFLESVGALGVGAFFLVVLQVSGKIFMLYKNGIANEEAMLAHLGFAISVFLLLNLVGEPWILGPGNPTFHLFWFYLATASFFSTKAHETWRAQRRARFIQRMESSKRRFTGAGLSPAA